MTTNILRKKLKKDDPASGPGPSTLEHTAGTACHAGAGIPIVPAPQVHGQAWRTNKHLSK